MKKDLYDSSVEALFYFFYILIAVLYINPFSHNFHSPRCVPGTRPYTSINLWEIASQGAPHAEQGRAP